MAKQNFFYCIVSITYVITDECLIYVSYLAGREWPGGNTAVPLRNCFGSLERGQHYSTTLHCSCSPEEADIKHPSIIIKVNC